MFHATGSGGKAMEGLIADGFIAAVADVTTTELADEVVGGVLSAGPNRLEAAGDKGIPQVVSVGALDMVNFGPRATVPPMFDNRILYEHNANVTLMRTTPLENIEVGIMMAHKLNMAIGKTVLMLPLRGVSMIDADGQAFDDPRARMMLFSALRDHLHDEVQVIEVDAHINDDVFADAFAEQVLRGLGMEN